MKYSKLGRMFGLIFLGLTFTASLPPLFGGDPFLALPLFLLGLPWNFLLSPLIDSLGYIQWYGQFSGSTDTTYLYSIFATLGILPGALINAGILYVIGALFDSSPKREGVENEAISPQRATIDRVWRKFNIFFGLFLLLPLLSWAIPFEAMTGDVSVAYFFTSIGISIGRLVVLSYFGYAITQRKGFLLLGLLGALRFYDGLLGFIGMCIGYVILLRAKNTPNTRLGALDGTST